MQSVRALFTAALVPGLLATGFLIVGAVVVAKIRNYPVLEATSWGERWVATRRALPSMLLPVLILGGIYTGAYTPTEAAVISVVYAVIISQVFYARISFRRLLLTIGRSIPEASLIMVILATAMMLGHYLTTADIGTMILDGINAAGLGRMGFLLLIMGALLILGTFMEVTSMLLIMMTVLLPALIALDINTIHFAVLFVVAMEIGLLTPPVGMNLFVVARSGQGSLQEAIKGVLPFVGLLALLLVMLIFVPQISLWLPAQMP